MSFLGSTVVKVNLILRVINIHYFPIEMIYVEANNLSDFNYNESVCLFV
jgi:hypothetical protein